MKKLRLLLFILLALTVSGAALLSRADAKGPADKITISGPGLDEMIEITEPDTAEALSMAMIEDFRNAIDVPERLGPGYELTRFYRLENDTYQPFDQVAYYPDLYGGSGYVNYIGIVNGWSEYDGKWFRARAEADEVIRQVLFEHGVLLPANLLPVEAYLAVTGNDGTLRLLDATTLEDAGTLRLEGEVVSLDGVIGSLDGQRLYVSTTDGAGTAEQRVLNLASARRSCVQIPAGRAVTLTPGAAGLVVENGDTLEIRGAEGLEPRGSIPLPKSTGSMAREYFPSPDRRWLYILSYDVDQAAIYPLNLSSGEFAPAISLDAPAPDAVFAGQWETDGRRFHLFNGERVYTIDGRRRLITVERIFFRRGDDTVRLAEINGQLAFAGARQEMLYLYNPVGPDGGVFAIDIWDGTQRQLWQPDRVFSHVIYGDGRFYALQTGSDELVALDAVSGAVVAARPLEAGEQLAALVWLSPDMVETGAALTLACYPGQ